MKDGICPKCGSGEVFKRKSGAIPVNWIRSTFPVNYVCADCGYVEWYVEERNHLDLIRDKWERANPRKRKN